MKEKITNVKLESLPNDVFVELSGSGVILVWLEKRQAVLMWKDKAKGIILRSYRPITCLPLVWKLLTDVLTGEICDYLERKMFLPEGQMGWTVKGQAIYCLLRKLYAEKCKQIRGSWQSHGLIIRIRMIWLLTAGL